MAGDGYDLKTVRRYNVTQNGMNNTVAKKPCMPQKSILELNLM
jgi:hypothetical protein